MIYLNNNKLNVKKLNSSYSWLDTGTFDTLLEASNYVKNLEKINYSCKAVFESFVIGLRT